MNIHDVERFGGFLIVMGTKKYLNEHRAVARGMSEMEHLTHRSEAMIPISSPTT